MPRRTPLKFTYHTVTSTSLSSMSRSMLPSVRWFSWQVQFGGETIVPTWNCSQRCLWITLSNGVMVSRKSHCCRVFQTFFFSPGMSLPESSECLLMAVVTVYMGCCLDFNITFLVFWYFVFLECLEKPFESFLGHFEHHKFHLASLYLREISNLYSWCLQTSKTNIKTV